MNKYHQNASNTEDQYCKESDILIVGFGFSTIPLVRELEASNANYIIISSGKNLWERLEEKNKLDFDLVSSTHSSMYSFEIVNRDVNDSYPTAREYLDFQNKYKSKYKSKVIDEWVDKVENYEDYSIVTTSNKRKYKCKHLIIATAFKRKIHEEIEDKEYKDIRNKTFVFNTMGDSANLLISKLIPHNNKIIVLSTGFVCFDKMFVQKIKNKLLSVTIDQTEYHTFRNISRSIYRSAIIPGLQQQMAVILSPTANRIVCAIPGLKALTEKIDDYLTPLNFYTKYPAARRNETEEAANFSCKAAIPNGTIAIKYWPIDTYETLFNDDHLKEYISKGFLLNDIIFFVEQGLVEIFPKKETLVDRENCVIKCNDKIYKYDSIIDGDRETPNLPLIQIHHNNQPINNYTYVYKNCYMGIMPKELSNVYFIGYTRPTTGGLNNIIEMQCLFVHQIITNPKFHKKIKSNLDEKIKTYNKYYYGISENRLNDHLVHYGQYTEDLAKILKINPTLKECRSINDIIKFYFFPNNAFKYRQKGIYKVDGAKEMLDAISQNHGDFKFIMHNLLGNLLDRIAILALLITLLVYYLPLYSVLILLPIFYSVVYLVTRISHYFPILLHEYVNILYFAAIPIALYFFNPWIFIAVLPIKIVITFILRKAGYTRVVFNDLKFRKNAKYINFFKRYLDVYNA